MTDEEQHKDTLHWPSEANIVSLPPSDVLEIIAHRHI